jgi:hypothetical protein
LESIPSQPPQITGSEWRQTRFIVPPPGGDADPPWMRPVVSFQAQDAAHDAFAAFGPSGPRSIPIERRSVNAELARGLMIEAPASAAGFRPVSSSGSTNFSVGNLIPNPKRRTLPDDLNGDIQKF